MSNPCSYMTDTDTTTCAAFADQTVYQVFSSPHDCYSNHIILGYDCRFVKTFRKSQNSLELFLKDPGRFKLYCHC